MELPVHCCTCCDAMLSTISCLTAASGLSGPALPRDPGMVMVLIAFCLMVASNFPPLSPYAALHESHHARWLHLKDESIPVDPQVLIVHQQRQMHSNLRARSRSCYFVCCSLPFWKHQPASGSIKTNKCCWLQLLQIPVRQQPVQDSRKSWLEDRFISIASSCLRFEVPSWDVRCETISAAHVAGTDSWLILSL